MAINTMGKGKRKSRYAKPRSDQTLRVILDNGNSQIKSMVDKHFGREVVMPHRVHEITESEFKDLKERYRYKSTDLRGTSIFGYLGRYYQVGMQPEQLNKGRRLTGAEKYVPEHFGAMTIASLLQIYPESHDDILATVLHPPSVTSQNLKRMGKCVYGMHRVETLGGEKITYKVAGVIPIEEAVGGLQSFFLTTESTYRQNLPIQFEPGMQILVIDVGGWISTMCVVMIHDDGELDVNLSAPTIQAGVQNVIDTLNRELKQVDSRLEAIEKIPDKIIKEALMTDAITIKGKDPERPDKVVTAVENSMGQLGRSIEQEYKQRFASGVAMDAVIVTGGGGGVLFNYLTDRILDHDYVFPAEDRIERMQFSNVRGASKGWVTESKK